MLATAFLAACGGEGAEPEVDQVTVASNEVPEPGASPFHSDPGRFYLIQNEDGLLALFTKCPHQGCTVNWDGGNNEFHCPCHNSRFDRHGNRTGGPAERALDLMTIAVRDDGSLNVMTDHPATRLEWQPDQSVKPEG